MNVEKKGDYYFIHNSYYDILKKECEKIYIFDSNVVLDISRFYYNPKNGQQKESIKSLFRELGECRYDCSYAITELTCNRSKGNVNPERAEKLSNAVIRMLNFTEEQIDELIKKSYNNIYIKNDKQEFNNNISVVIENTLPMLFRAFVPLSVLFYCMKDVNKNNKMDIFEKYLECVDENIKAVSIYELIIAVFYLLNNEKEFNTIQKFIKATNKIDIISKVWNVSWDITFLRYIDDISRNILEGKEPDERNAILVTKDKSLAKTAKFFKINPINYDNSLIPGMYIDSKRIKDIYLNRFREVDDNIFSDEKRKKRMNFFKELGENEIKYYSPLADDFTKKLMEKYKV